MHPNVHDALERAISLYYERHYKVIDGCSLYMTYTTVEKLKTDFPLGRRPPQGGFSAIEIATPAGTFPIHPVDAYVPMPLYSANLLPDNCAALFGNSTTSSGRSVGLQAIFDFGYSRADLSVHSDGFSMANFLRHKGVGARPSSVLGTEPIRKKGLLDEVLSNRAAKADWNF